MAWLSFVVDVPLLFSGACAHFRSGSFAAGVALVFVPAIGEYVIPALLGGPQAELVGTVLWGEFFANRDWPTASAVAVWLLVVLVVVPGVVVRTFRLTQLKR